MSDLLARLQQDLTLARKAQDKPGTLLLGTILADATNRRIELRRALTDEEVQDVLRRGIKKRREAADLFAKGRREDLAARERAEVARLEAYLPAVLSDDEVRGAIRAAIASGARSIGPLMGAVMPGLKGRADGATINRIAREELAKQSA